MNTDEHGFSPAGTRLAKPDAEAIIGGMSTVMEIKSAIERLSPVERVKLHTMIWPEEGETLSDTPPRVREKLAEAGNGSFKTGSRDNIGKNSA